MTLETLTFQIEGAISSEMSNYLAGILALYRQFFESLEYYNKTDEDLLEALSDQKIITVLVDQQQEDPALSVRAFATIGQHIKEPQNWELGSAYVRQEERGQGLWKQMTDVLLGKARENHATSVRAYIAVNSEFLIETLLNMGFVSNLEEGEWDLSYKI